jgi:hypothetical protein
MIPLLVTAFAGAIPSTDERGAPKVIRSEPGGTRIHAGLQVWMGLVRTKANLAHLANDAVSHWKSLSVTSVSQRGRWESRRRGLMAQAWIADHRASFSRLRRLTNPHHLSYLEICMEFDHRHVERIS